MRDSLREADQTLSARRRIIGSVSDNGTSRSKVSSTEIDFVGLSGTTCSTARIQANSFEEIVRKLRLSPEQYVKSVQLKDWSRKNNDQKYVPSDLLKACDFEAASDF